MVRYLQSTRVHANVDCFAQIWLWTNFSRLDSSDWPDVDSEPSQYLSLCE